MFENPEKLFIIFVIALLIFGPSKLAGMGATIGRTIREFRNAVRGAQETFSMSEDQYGTPGESISLPEPVAPVGVSPGIGTPVSSGQENGEASSGSAARVVGGGEIDEISSLVSEPTAQALRENLAKAR